MNARTFVAAVLAPHDAENTEFRQVGLAFQDADDFLIFAFSDSVLFQDIRGNRHCDTSAFTIDSKINLPSALPRMLSLERSGCGIIPRMLRPSFTIPAMS